MYSLYTFIDEMSLMKVYHAKVNLKINLFILKLFSERSINHNVISASIYIYVQKILFKYCNDTIEKVS